ncbi:MAG TPA: hypothetical protein VNO21_11900 [Polyangiaceae bacterium]|nr:hypothetical protein [Polyangiaceae bacterium]
MTHSRFSLPCLLLLLGGCGASSGTGVPAIDAELLHPPTFDGLTPRSLMIQVTDGRNPLPSTSSDMVFEVTRALGERFRSAGFRIDAANNDNRLALTVTYKDTPLPGFQHDDCVWFKGRLTTVHGTWVDAEAGGCAEMHHITGIRMGGDASRAYETGLSGVIEQLDRGWARIGGPSSGPATPL